MAVIPCPSRAFLFLSTLQGETTTLLLSTVASESSPSLSLVHRHCPCPFLFLLATPIVLMLACQEGAAKKQGSMKKVSEVIFPVCCCSEAQALPFSIPPSVQISFPLLTKHLLYSLQKPHRYFFFLFKEMNL